MAKVIGTAADGNNSPLVHRLSHGVLLGDDEVAFLDGLQRNRISLGVNEDLVRDGEELKATFLICEGWAMRYRLTSAGRRQILGISLPGDLIGLQVNFQRRAIATVSAMSKLEVALIDPIRVLDIYREFPVLAAGLEWLAVHNFNILSEHNVSLGVRSARERILHFLLELWCRLVMIGQADETGFRLSMTQQQIADTMGLSQVHTNKSIRALGNEGLIETEGRKIVFPDLERAFLEADFDDRFLSDFRARDRRRNDPGNLLRRIDRD